MRLVATFSTTVEEVSSTADDTDDDDGEEDDTDDDTGEEDTAIEELASLPPLHAVRESARKHATNKHDFFFIKNFLSSDSNIFPFAMRQFFCSMICTSYYTQFSILYNPFRYTTITASGRGVIFWPSERHPHYFSSVLSKFVLYFVKAICRALDHSI